MTPETAVSASDSDRLLQMTMQQMAATRDFADDIISRIRDKSHQLTLRSQELDAGSRKFRPQNAELMSDVCKLDVMLYNIRNILSGRGIQILSPGSSPEKHASLSFTEPADITAGTNDSLLSGPAPELDKLMSPQKLVDEFRPSAPEPHKLMANDQLISMFLSSSIAGIKQPNTDSGSNKRPVLVNGHKLLPAPQSSITTLNHQASQSQSLSQTTLNTNKAEPAAATSSVGIPASDISSCITSQTGLANRTRDPNVSGYRTPKSLPYPVLTASAISSPSISTSSKVTAKIRKQEKQVEKEPPHVVNLPHLHNVPPAEGLSGDHTGSVVHLVDPGQFYLTTKTESGLLADITRKMNQNYQSSAKRGIPLSEYTKTVMKSVESQLINSFWACKFSDGNWCRVRIVEIPDEKELVVGFVDYGNEMFTTADKLFPLKSEFTKLPALTHVCRMAGLKPLNDNKDWTQEQIEYFENCCQCSTGSYLNVRVMRTTNADASTMHDVFLSHEDIRQQLSTINQQLVDNQMAASDKFVPESHPKGLAATSVLPFKQAPNVFIPTGMESGEEGEDDIWKNEDLDRFESARNPEEAMIGFKPEFTGKTCKFYPLGTCKRGILCDFKHVMPEANFLTAKDEMPLDVMPGKEIELHEAYIVKVTSYRPGFVHVCFPAGIVRMRDMSEQEVSSLFRGHEVGMVVYQKMAKDLRDYYAKVMAEKRDILPAIGSLIAVRITDLNDLTMRCQVLIPGHEETIRVECIDNGLVYNVHRRHVFVLASQFTLIPAMSRMFRITNPKSVSGMDPVSLNRTYFVMRMTAIQDSFDDVPYVELEKMEHHCTLNK